MHSVLYCTVLQPSRCRTPFRLSGESEKPKRQNPRSEARAENTEISIFSNLASGDLAGVCMPIFRQDLHDRLDFRQPRKSKKSLFSASSRSLASRDPQRHRDIFLQPQFRLLPALIRCKYVHTRNLQPPVHVASSLNYPSAFCIHQNFGRAQTKLPQPCCLGYDVALIALSCLSKQRSYLIPRQCRNTTSRGNLVRLQAKNKTIRATPL